jgi:homoserine dehydrogenase
MNNVKIALLGFGNVGQGVWNILNTNMDEIKKKCNYNIEISKILVKDKQKQRDANVPSSLLTTDFNSILADEDIKIAVELIGGSEPAMEYMLKAMKAKKHVVTANKLVLAKNGQQLFKTAEEEGVHFYFEASVGGGIPIIREINESLTANKIEKITGIINGTTNYILSKMTLSGMEFSDALKEAQQLGYAEADPTSDIEGYDAAYKLAIMSSLAFKTKIDSNSIYKEGIEKITSFDISNADKFGYVIKLLAIGKEINNKLELRVHPTMIPKNHPLANVNDSFNSIIIEGNAVGELMLCGRGAGSMPTGSAVVGDIISILRNNFASSSALNLKNNLPEKQIQSAEDNTSNYYISLDVKDTPGVLGEISAVFGQNNVSISEVTHTNRHDDSLSLIFITQLSKNGDIYNSIKKIETFDIVNSVNNIIRIEK